nr:MAG TPA: hypothetical protein [Caudoviricetes sp.]
MFSVDKDDATSSHFKVMLLSIIEPLHYPCPYTPLLSSV